ncbi:hypothetical protein [Pseudomonas poae]|uniref:hypothetical protein n=1 Tax=Pseudomonas poae TaxID=200451 RepID=UPI0030D36811
MSSTKQLAVVVVLIFALATDLLAQPAAQPSGDGSWLQLSSESLLHGTTGQAHVVVRNGNQQASLDAPYEVVRAGFGGGAIKLRTSCGLMSFQFVGATQAVSGSTLGEPGVQLLGRKAGMSRCGLGERINLGWHLVAKGQIEG